MSWQPPYNPNVAYPPAGYSPYPPGALPPAPAGIVFPPGYPTGSTAPVTYPADPYHAGQVPPYYPGQVGQPTAMPYAQYPSSNISGYPPGTVAGYPPVHQGLYPSVPGGGYAYAPQDVVGYLFEPTEHERSKHRLDVKYSPSMDKYIRTSDHNQETNGWRSLVYAEQNMSRKVEEDHKMSYLSRKPESMTARIEWRFDLSRTGQRVKHLHLQFPTKVYEDGLVQAFVASDRGDSIRMDNSDRSQEIVQIRGCQRFSVIAELSRGKGEHAWQHAQLFRQQLSPGFFSTDDSHYPFRVSVELE